MDNSATPHVTNDTCSSSPLPPWLARHVEVAFNGDDVAALLASIESSQNSTSAATPLPAEIILRILEYVPVDHVLDWRLVCHGFRDALDGRILYHHLQRTQLVGYLGPRNMWPLQNLTDEQYDRMKFLYANFQHVEDIGSNEMRTLQSSPIWCSKYAVFKIDYSNFGANPEVYDAGLEYDGTIEYADAIWNNALNRLELEGTEEGFGTLRWCIKLDHAVLDLDFPLDATRTSFDIAINLHSGTIKVAWKEMLFRFLKSEAELRRMLDQRSDSNFTFSLTEDCLREVRRQRLHSNLDLNKKGDRHLKWSLRLLRPLFGKPQQDRSPLELAENNAVNALLFIRREAAMTTKYIAHLRQLKNDLETMEADIDNLGTEFETFKTHLSSRYAHSIAIPIQPDEYVPYNPILWPDDLCQRIEKRVSTWRSQKKVIQQMHALLASSNQALAVPEDSFDDLGSDI